MRYRPFGPSGMAVSAITLRLTDAPRLRAEDWRGLVLAALETGINSFVFDAASPPVLDGAAQAFASLDRRLLFLAWRLRGDQGLVSNSAIKAMLDAVRQRDSLGRLDLVILDDPKTPDLPAELAQALRPQRESGMIGALALAGRGEAESTQKPSGDFAALSASFNLSSGWAERNRIREAMARDIAVIGEDFWPRTLRERETRPAPKPSLWRRRTDPLTGLGGYDFLDHTPGWTAEEICLAYALTEPSLATVQVSAVKREHIEALAAVAERELPTGCAAQIEMARFSAREAERSRRPA